VGLRLQKDEKYIGKQIYVNACMQGKLHGHRLIHAKVVMLRYTESVEQPLIRNRNRF
jgi:hypothetical protein